MPAVLLSRAPSWALCGDTPADAGRETSRRPAEHALTQRFCQLNPRKRVGVLLLDIDHTNGLNDLDAPPPTYVTVNPKTGHLHAGYVLAAPVSVGAQSRRGPLELLRDVRNNLTHQLKADPSFGGLIARGPFHPEHATHLVSGRLWTLGELLRELPPMQNVSAREAAQAAAAAENEGRNVAVFEALRHVAYRVQDQGLTGASLMREVQQHADDLNRNVIAKHVAGQLSDRELSGIVRSICRWTETHRAPRRSATGSVRSRIHSRDRIALSEVEQRERRQAGQAQTAAARRTESTARLRSAEQELLAAGQQATAAALATHTGVSRATALRYLRSTAASDEID